MSSCEKCTSEDDVRGIIVPAVGGKDEQILYCGGCRIRMFDGEVLPLDNPTICGTRNLNITLSEADWDWVEEKSNGNYPLYIGSIISHTKKLSIALTLI